MEVLTGFLLAAFCGYAGSWYFGLIEGNFALLMLMAVVISGSYWLAEKFYFWPQRLKAVEQLERENAKRHQELTKMGIDRVDTDTGEARDRLLMQPWWLDWTAGLFPVILVVFVLRSFLFEPFKIPSGSMI
ncbi:MAG: Signal peptidase, partial [Pseudomonadota bacterium]